MKHAKTIMALTAALFGLALALRPAVHAGQPSEGYGVPAADVASTSDAGAGSRIQALGSGEMAVGAVTARYLKNSNSSLRRICDVLVLDSNGDQVQGATVTAVMTNDWKATLTQTVTEVYPNDWFVRFGPSDVKARCGLKGVDAFTCTVTNVTHPTLTYVPAENLMTTDTKNCPQ